MLTLEKLSEWAERHAADLDAEVARYSLGGRLFDFNRERALMGVINLSHDSWYRESVCLSVHQAVRRGRVLSAQGAAVVDIGAESTLLHAEGVDPQTQADRLTPVIRELTGCGVAVSAETYSRASAERCLDAGAEILNLTGVGEGRDIYRMAAERGAAVIICYVQGAHARAVDDLTISRDPIADMLEYFARETDLACAAGARRVFIDPGLGFYYKNLKDSRDRIRYQARAFLETFRLRRLGFPVCHALPHAFECFGEEVRSAEPFFAVLAALGKTGLFRTHEVSRVKAVLDALSLL